jgi:membrane-bound lytic murein transglycosylase B
MTDQGFQDWIAERAPDWVGLVDFLPEVLEKDAAQPEKVTAIWDYLDRAVSGSRVATGQHWLQHYASDLAIIAERFGVAPEYLIAIWGLETNFGAVMGDFHVPSAVATLAYGSTNNRRQQMFLSQMGALQGIITAGAVSFHNAKGSWAGAMGHTQFMPTTYRDFAVAFDRTSRSDIWGKSPIDALCSTAHYLAKSGWCGTENPLIISTLETDFDYSTLDISQKRTLSEWARLGLATTDAPDALYWGYAPAGSYGPVILFGPEAGAIYEYNRSPFYALAIIQLADRIAGRDRFVIDWGNPPEPLGPRELRELQERLTQAGHDTQGTDGLWGRNSRAALISWQRDAGMNADGYATRVILDRLRKS